MAILPANIGTNLQDLVLFMGHQASKSKWQAWNLEGPWKIQENKRVGRRNPSTVFLVYTYCMYIHVHYVVQTDGRARRKTREQKKNLCQYNTSANIVIAPVGTLLDFLG